MSLPSRYGLLTYRMMAFDGVETGPVPAASVAVTLKV